MATTFRRGQRVQIPRRDSSPGKQLATFLSRIYGEYGPAAQAWVRDSAGRIWRVRIADIEDASPRRFGPRAIGVYVRIRETGQCGYVLYAGDDGLTVGLDGGYRVFVSQEAAEPAPPDTAAQLDGAQTAPENSALDLVTLWLNDSRLHSDPGTLDDVFDAIRATGRYVAPNPLRCCSHDDDYEGDPADLIADAKAALFNRILARVADAGERASAEQMLENLLYLAQENMTADAKTRIAQDTLGIRQPGREDER